MPPHWLNSSFSAASRGAPVRCTHPVDPVLLVLVVDAAVERARSEDQDEVPRVADAVQQVVVKLARSQLLYVEEDGQSSHLKVDFQQTTTT